MECSSSEKGYQMSQDSTGKVSRRKFIIAGGIVGTAGVIGLSFFTEQLAKLIPAGEVTPAEMILNYYNYLTIDLDGLNRYLVDYENAYGKIDMNNLTEDLFTKFLLSSDFFQNGADESRVVYYQILYDPYLTPCYNPFAILD